MFAGAHTSQNEQDPFCRRYTTQTAPSGSRTQLTGRPPVLREAFPRNCVDPTRGRSSELRFSIRHGRHQRARPRHAACLQIAKSARSMQLHAQLYGNNICVAWKSVLEQTRWRVAMFRAVEEDWYGLGVRYWEVGRRQVQ